MFIPDIVARHIFSMLSVVVIKVLFCHKLLDLCATIELFCSSFPKFCETLPVNFMEETLKEFKTSRKPLKELTSAVLKKHVHGSCG